MTADTIAVETFDEPDDDSVMDQIEQALERAGVPLAPLAASAGWVSSLAGAALYGVGGGAAMVIAGLGAACATAAAGRKYRRPGGARRAGAGRQSVARHGSPGLAGGSGRRAGGSLFGGSGGGRRSGGGSSGGGGRSGRLFSSGRSGAGGLGSARRSGSGGSGLSGRSGGRAGLGLPSVGGGGKGAAAGRSGGSSGAGGGRRFGLGRRGGAAGLSGSGSGRSASGGRAGRLRTMLGRGARTGGSGTSGGPSGTGASATRRRLFGRTPGASARPASGAAPGSGSSIPAPANRRRGWRRFKGTWPPPKPHPNAEPRFASDRRNASGKRTTGARPVGDTVADPKRTATDTKTAPKAAARPQRKPSTPPGARGKTSTTSGGTMGKLRIVELSEEMAASVAALDVQPGEMYDLLKEMEFALEKTSENLAQMWKNMADAIRQKMPLHPAAGEVMDSVVAAQAHVGTTAAQWPALVRRIHQPDIDRFESPRTNERAWNVR